jgi:hypothetical protein
VWGFCFQGSERSAPARSSDVVDGEPRGRTPACPRSRPRGRRNAESPSPWAPPRGRHSTPPAPRSLRTRPML